MSGRDRARLSTTKRFGLARALSKLGFCSRTRAADLIREGRVKLNGKVRRDPETPVRQGADRIEVDNTRIEAQKKTYLMLNKPRGVVTTASDEKGRRTVYEFLGEFATWLAPVGRLDQASEGLLLFTNDSEWAARVTDPKTHLDKVYHVQVNAVADEGLKQSLVRGVRASGGETLRAKRVTTLREGERNCWLEIVLDEGKNRQIRRMLESLDLEVLRLVRVAIGPVILGDLKKGEVRALTAKEKMEMDRAMRSAEKTPSRR